MDAWRHLPAWQLERRADLFFGVFLATVLEATFDVAINPRIVPELPLLKRLVQARARPGLSSVKLDYFAMAADGSRGFLVELKTDVRSRRAGQDAYLHAAQRVGLPALMQGVVDIVVGPRLRDVHRDHKYAWMVHALSELGCLTAPDAYRRAVYAEDRTGLTAAARSLAVTAPDCPLEVVYVQPVRSDEEASGTTTIDFEAFAAVIEATKEPMGARFAQSLRDWTCPPAAEPPG